MMCSSRNETIEDLCEQESKWFSPARFALSSDNHLYWNCLVGVVILISGVEPDKSQISSGFAFDERILDVLIISCGMR